MNPGTVEISNMQLRLVHLGQYGTCHFYTCLRLV